LKRIIKQLSLGFEGYFICHACLQYGDEKKYGGGVPNSQDAHIPESG